MYFYMVKGSLRTFWGKIFILDWSYGEILADSYKNVFFDIFLRFNTMNLRCANTLNSLLFSFLDNNYDI